MRRRAVPGPSGVAAVSLELPGRPLAVDEHLHLAGVIRSQVDVGHVSVVPSSPPRMTSNPVDPSPDFRPSYRVAPQVRHVQEVSSPRLDGCTLAMTHACPGQVFAPPSAPILGR